MILPIVAYGDPVLKREAKEIAEDHPGLKDIIANMFETMYAARGVGLAAPQVGLGIRLFIVDTAPFGEGLDEEEDDPDEYAMYKAASTFKKIFVNPIILEEDGRVWPFNEGCLSIPGIREDVSRQEKLIIEYQDENFDWHEETYDGLIARVIQHEYDHIEGVLFTDRLSPIRRQFLRKKLTDISHGRVPVEYKMKFPKK